MKKGTKSNVIKNAGAVLPKKGKKAKKAKKAKKGITMYGKMKK